jgi:hypothetical protein
MTKEKKNETVDLNTGANRFATGAETDAIEPRASCVFYSSWHDAISRLPQKEQLNAYKMILDYSLNFIEPEDDKSLAYTIFVMAKPSIESAEERYNESVEKGKKGGRPSVIDKEQVLELSSQGMKPAEIAKKLGYNRDSVKSIIYRNKGANANLNENVNETVNENDDDKKEKLVSEASSETASPITESATPPPPTPTELTYEEEVSVIKEFKKRKKPIDISKELSLDLDLVNLAIDEYKERGYKFPPKPEEIKNYDVPLMNGGYLKQTKEELFNMFTDNGRANPDEIHWDTLRSEFALWGVNASLANQILAEFEARLLKLHYVDKQAS